MRLRDYFNIIPLLVFATVASVHSIYPVYDPRTRQYGPFEGNYPANAMGSYMPPYAASYRSPYPSPYMNPNPSPYMNPNPAPYMNSYPAPGFNPYPAPGLNPYPAPGLNPYPAPGLNPYPAPGLNPYPDPYRNPYPSTYRNPNPADAHPQNFPHPVGGDPSQRHPAYEDLHALVQHRLPGFFGKHEHRLLWSPKLHPEEQGIENVQPGFQGPKEPLIPKSNGPVERGFENVQPGFQGPKEPPIPKSSGPEERGFGNVQPGFQGPKEPPIPKSPGSGHYRSYVPSNETLTIPHSYESNGSNSQPVNPEGHNITKRQVNNPPASVSELKNQLYTEFAKTLSLGDNYSSDDLIKLYIHVLLHPNEFKHPDMYAEYIAWLIALKYKIYVSKSTVFQMYPQFARVENGTMTNTVHTDSPSLGPAGGSNLKPGNYTSYYKEGHVEQTGGTYNKLLFGAKRSIYNDYRSLDDQRDINDLV